MVRKLLYINFILFTTPSAGQRSWSNHTCGYLRTQYRKATLQNESEGCCGKPDSTIVLPEVDITGYGICGKQTINMTRGWQWTQYPAPLNVSRVLSVDTGFTGKNAIVWSANGTQMFGFVIGEITNGTIIGVTDIIDENDGVQTEILQGPCHFTLDAVTNPPSYDTYDPIRPPTVALYINSSCIGVLVTPNNFANLFDVTLDRRLYAAYKKECVPVLRESEYWYYEGLQYNCNGNISTHDLLEKVESNPNINVALWFNETYICAPATVVTYSTIRTAGNNIYRKQIICFQHENKTTCLFLR